jgi:hypothetical protein
VGRDREVAELIAGLEDAAGGRGRLFLIAGEPGIGKTWLAEQLTSHAIQRGARVLWGRCWEGGGAPPFWPWTQMIRTLAEDRDEEALAAYLGAGAAHVAQLVPGLAERLGTTAIPEVSSLTSDATRFYLFEAIAGLFERAASAEPLLLVLDDLHAADDPSMLLQFLARDLRASRLLVVGTYRDVEADRRPGVNDAVGSWCARGSCSISGVWIAERSRASSKRSPAWCPLKRRSPPFTRQRRATRCSSGRPCACWLPRPPWTTPVGRACRSRAASGR